MSRLHVVIGILQNSKGEFCLSLRPAHKHLGNLWEFPGGKCEGNEAPLEALKREFFEELGIEVLTARPFMQFPYDYPTHHVFLDYWQITEYRGDPQGCEGQLLRWVLLEDFKNYPLPDANQPVVEALCFLPPC